MLRIGEPFVLRVSVPVTSNVERLTHAARSTSATGRKPTAADRVGLGAIARSRLGGDEFVAYTVDDEQPEVILARIEANLRAFNLMQERPYCVAMSAGVVLVDSSVDQTLSHYVLLADEQMYAQKRSRLH